MNDDMNRLETGEEQNGISEETRERYRGKRVAHGARERQFWADYGYLLVTAAVVILLFRVLLQLAWVPTGSMETTIPTHTLLISWRLPYLVSDPEPERGDIVTFWDDELGKILVKRVIGLPGDRISFEGGYVYINDKKLDESYLPEQGQTQSDAQEVFEVPEGCIFVMGDNRAGSYDSRFLGQPYIPIENIKAHVMIGISVGKENSWRGIRAIG